MICEMYNTVNIESIMLFTIICALPGTKFMTLQKTSARIRVKSNEKANPVKSNDLDVESRSMISKREKAAKKNM